jgi:hypothetical protein
VIFACLPEKEGSTSMTVKYDDHLNEAWDATGTIKYVEPSLGSADNSAEAPDRVTTDESGNPLRDLLKPFL